jgi:hypothetical protein
MTDATGPSRPPWRGALVVFATVLCGYVLSLAPSVTFWDAGEFIAATKTLGIPHPPGTPLFVLLGHVWALLVPFGEYAWRTNLMSAVFGAAGAALWFLVAFEVARGITRDLDSRSAVPLQWGAAVSAALVSAFGFTAWHNANETEVYGVATCTIALITWLGLRWRAQRGTARASRLLLLAVYLGGLSMGNHLLALLTGPALIAFLVAVLRTAPASDPAQARREWGEVAVVAGIWSLLIGTGLGSTTLVTVGSLLFGMAAVFAWRWGAGRFALLSWVLASVGVTIYLFLYIRAGHRPMINEADPSTWEALLAVIRREQYPPRTPFDDPTVLSGPDNPGRSLALMGLQLLNYVQYFDWQWAKGVTATLGGVPLRVLFTLAFAWLGVRGLVAHRRADRSSWWLLFSLFLVTGLGLVAYMNFKPGFSIGYEHYPSAQDHEVRERDYFFIASFLVWGVWAGIGLGWLAARAAGPLRRAAPAVFLLAVVPFVLNFREASRRQGPDARLAGDWAYSLLNSVPPYGVLFTFGDNDTFPLWWAQEVEGIRQDVTVVCLALAETDWYMRQLRDNPVRPVDEAAAPAIWRGLRPSLPDRPVHSMTDDEIRAAVPQYLRQDITVRFGDHQVVFPRNSVLYGKDFVSIRILQETFGRRPVAWALSAAGNFYQLEPFLVQQGLAIRVLPAPPDTARLRYDLRRVMGVPLDIPATDSLLVGTYRYAGLLAAEGQADLETTARSTAATMGVPFTQMAYAMEAQGDLQGMLRYLEPATRLSSNPALRAARDELRARVGAQGLQESAKTK